MLTSITWEIDTYLDGETVQPITSMSCPISILHQTVHLLRIWAATVVVGYSDDNGTPTITIYLMTGLRRRSKYHRRSYLQRDQQYTDL